MSRSNKKQMKLFSTEPKPPGVTLPVEIMSEVVSSLAELLLARARAPSDTDIEPRGDDEYKDHA